MCSWPLATSPTLNSCRCDERSLVCGVSTLWYVSAQGQLKTDELGYLVLPQAHRTNTSVPGVFASGDVADLCVCAPLSVLLCLTRSLGLFVCLHYLSLLCPFVSPALVLLVVVTTGRPLRRPAQAVRRRWTRRSGSRSAGLNKKWLFVNWSFSRRVQPPLLGSLQNLVRAHKPHSSLVSYSTPLPSDLPARFLSFKNGA